MKVSYFCLLGVSNEPIDDPSYGPWLLCCSVLLSFIVALEVYSLMVLEINVRKYTWQNLTNNLKFK